MRERKEKRGGHDDFRGWWWCGGVLALGDSPFLGTWGQDPRFAEVSVWTSFNVSSPFLLPRIIPSSHYYLVSTVSACLLNSQMLQIIFTTSSQ